MTIVFPLLLGGLALVTIPILIHLVMRQKPKTLKFPAFRFLIQRHRTNQRKLRLRHLLLLALRVCLLALVCLALARLKVFSNPLSLSTDRPVAAVLLFDTSLSMEYKMTGGRTRLEEAKKRGLELLDELPEGSRVAVLDTAEKVGTGKNVWLLSLTEARDRIGELRLRPDSEAVTARLQDAYRIFGELSQDKEDFKARQLPRFLCVFSDGMKACWQDGDLPAVQEKQDMVPVPLEKLQLIQNTIESRIELLQQLRKALPPEKGTDYPDQSLIDLWRQLQQQLPEAYPEDVSPQQPLGKTVIQLRARTRELLQMVRTRSPNELTTEAREFRQKVVDALEEVLPQLSGVYAVFVDVGVANPTDLAIVELEFPDDAAGEGQQVFRKEDKFTLKAVVQATGQDFESSVQYKVGDKQQSLPALAFPNGQKRTVPIEIDCSKLTPGPQPVEVWLGRPDLLPFTNRRFATFQVRQPRKILIVTDHPRAVDVWRTGVQLSPWASFQCAVESPTRAVDLGPDGLRDYEAVYLISVAKPSPALWTALATYVDQGGSLAIIPGGEDLDKDAYNEETARKLLPAQLQKVVKADPGAVWNWGAPDVFKHPMLQKVREWQFKDRADFIKVPRRAVRYWAVEPAADGRVIVAYNDPEKRPAVVERPAVKGKGRVVLLTTRVEWGLTEPWNNYLDTNNSFIAVLPALLTRYLAGDAQRPQFNFRNGDVPPRVQLPLQIRESNFWLKGPDQLEQVTRPSEQNKSDQAEPAIQSADPNVLILRQAVAPGNYRVYVPDGRKQVVGAFSVNFNPAEANLQHVPRADLETILGRGSVVAVDWHTDLSQVLHGYWTEPAELFPWLMLVVLLFLALENLLGNLFYRREPQPQA